MTIASAFNDIAVAQGGTAAKSGAITAAIDALNDALAGSDQPQAKTIEQAVRLLGEHIGGGGGASIGDIMKLPYEIYFEPTIGLTYDPSQADSVVASGVSIGEKTILPWQDMYNIEQTAVGVTVTVTSPFEKDFQGAYILTVDMSDQTGTIAAVEPVEMPISHSTATQNDVPIHLYSWAVVENPNEFVQDVSAKVLVVYINEE